VLTAAAVTVKSPAAEPAAITTEDGIVTLAVETMPVFTASPAVGAGADTVTVHVAEPGVVTVAGEQTSPVTAYTGLIITSPPIPVMLTGIPLSMAPLLLVTWMVEDVLVVVGDTVNVAVATMPSLSAVLLIPNSRHLYDPGLPLHETDFPAATATGPGTTLTAVKSPAE
jgi:hypothetical protein